MSILRVELRRFTARRAVRAIGALVLLGVIAGATLTFVFSNRDFAAATSRARGRATAEYQSCLRDPAAFAEHGEQATCIEPDLTSIQADPRFHLTALTEVLTNLSALLIILGLALGATFVGAEWHHRSITATLTWEPRRLRVATAKLGACAAAVFAGVLAAEVLLSGALIPAALFRGTTDGTTASWLSHTIGLGLRGAAIAGVASLIGAALAFVSRSTAFAVGICFVWLSIIEGIIRQAKPGWSRWMIGDNVAGFVEGGGVEAPRTALGSGLLLVVYISALAWIAAASFKRRDVA